jgi:hypothetical protein
LIDAPSLETTFTGPKCHIFRSLPGWSNMAFGNNYSNTSLNARADPADAAAYQKKERDSGHGNGSGSVS